MIVVCGEALVDLVPRLCGDETGYVPRGGGSPYNVGIGLGRLGVPVGFLGRLSRDRFGRMLGARLESNGVDMRFVREGDESSTVAMVHLAAGDEPEYAFYGEGTADALFQLGDLPASFPDEVAALHFGSISLLREPGASTYEACMRREQGRRVLSLDPNVRPGLIADRSAYVRRLEGWIGLMDLVKVSSADLAWLYPGRPVPDVVRQWRALGPSLMVVTQGVHGAVGFGAGEPVTSAAMDVSVVDTVGAGDAFTTGLLAWLHDHGCLDRHALRDLGRPNIAESLAQANQVAALACTRSGAEPPTRAELASASAR